VEKQIILYNLAKGINTSCGKLYTQSRETSPITMSALWKSVVSINSGKKMYPQPNSRVLRRSGCPWYLMFRFSQVSKYINNGGILFIAALSQHGDNSFNHIARYQ
jgi:surface antigen